MKAFDSFVLHAIMVILDLMQAATLPPLEMWIFCWGPEFNQAQSVDHDFDEDEEKPEESGVAFVLYLRRPWIDCGNGVSEGGPVELYSWGYPSIESAPVFPAIP